jgi:hypothetical protein
MLIERARSKDVILEAALVVRVDEVLSSVPVSSTRLPNVYLLEAKNATASVLAITTRQDNLAASSFSTTIMPAQFQPYPTQAAFDAANGDYYRLDNAREKAWNVYSAARFSTSDKAAILYKNTDLHGGRFPQKLIDDLRAGEDLVATGRLYSSAAYHCWPVNAAWVLAQIHKGREFVMLSDFSGTNAMRTHDQKVYSALTKEVACAFKAGYVISRIDYKSSTSLVYLSPTAASVNANQFGIHDLLVTDSECKEAVQKVNGRKRRFAIGMRAAFDLQALFSIAESGSLADIEDILESKPDMKIETAYEFIRKDELYESSKSTTNEVVLETDEEINQLQARSILQLTRIVGVLQRLAPAELNDFIAYYNQLRDASGPMPALPVVRQPPMLFGKAFMSVHKIEDILKAALTTCLLDRPLQVLFSPR